MEPQVQLDQPGHIGHHAGREAERRQPGPGHLRALHLVVVEGHPPAWQLAAGLGLADVMQQRGQPEPQVALQAVPALQGDGLVEHGQRVLVDILVPEMLVLLEAQRRHLREHLVGHPGVDQKRDALGWPAVQGRLHELGQLGRYSLHGHLRRPHQRGQLGHGLAQLRRDRETELGDEPGRAQHPQRIITERILRPGRRAQQAALQVTQAPERVDELMPGQPRRHRVDGEIAAGQVVGERGAVRDLRLA